MTRAPLPPSPCRGLPCSGRVFQGGPYARSDPLCAMRLTGRTLHLREVLHHLQGAAQRAPLHRRSLLLPGLPGSLRRLASHQPWPLKPKLSACSSMPTRAWQPRPEAWSAISPIPRDSRTTTSLDCNPRLSLRARKLLSIWPRIILNCKSLSRAFQTAWKLHSLMEARAHRLLASIL